jgi:chromosome segregation protein
METAQSQKRELEDGVLTLTGKLDAQEKQVSELTAQLDGLMKDLVQIQSRAGQVEQDTAAARVRIQALEGSAAALRAEAEGKARGQSELKERLDEIGRAVAACNVELAALEAEKSALDQALSELLTLRQTLSGDRSRQMETLTRLEAENELLSAQALEREEKLQELRGKSRERTENIRRLGEEKLELEAGRNRADKESRDRNTELLAMEREVAFLEQKKAAAAMEEKQILDKLWDSYELSHEAAQAQRLKLESVSKAGRRVAELKRAIADMGNINLDAIEEFRRVNERYTYLTQQRDDVEKSKKELERIIGQITGEMKTIFAREFQAINRSFVETFTELFGGGSAALELEDENDILNCGIEIKVQPPGKTLKVISLLSGGEKAFVAISLYFAILKTRPTPFCVLDEIEAALDDANVERFAQYLRSMSDKTQYILITHRRGTMEEADVLYGVTMQEQGVSRMLTINLNDVEKELHIS